MSLMTGTVYHYFMCPEFDDFRHSGDSLHHDDRVQKACVFECQ